MINTVGRMVRRAGSRSEMVMQMEKVKRMLLLIRMDNSTTCES